MKFTFLLPLLLFNFAHAQEPSNNKPAFVGRAIDDCKCQNVEFGDELEKFVIKKNITVDSLCFSDRKDAIFCSTFVGSGYSCPKSCFELVAKPLLTKEESLKQIKKSESEARIKYSKMIPKKILNQINKKYPGWQPVLINEAYEPLYFADFKLMEDFYFQVPIHLEKNPTDVSIVFFYENIDRLWENSMAWSFWDSKTGELLYEKIAPFKSADQGYLNKPCLSPVGKDLKDVVMSVTAVGPSDAGICCGPYYFNDLRKPGPILVTDNKDLEKQLGFTADPEKSVYKVIYSVCSRSSDPKTGKFKPYLSKIDGPANIRESDSLTSKVIGSCADDSDVAIIGTRDKNWVSVYCQGKYGWTKKNNIKDYKY